jgi:hypothetical protein
MLKRNIEAMRDQAGRRLDELEREAESRGSVDDLTQDTAAAFAMMTRVVELETLMLACERDLYPPDLRSGRGRIRVSQPAGHLIGVTKYQGACFPFLSVVL